ncbi:MAG: hypothetical protein H6856_02115 [Rhodospirillales bacterium]|nr:hypothetical protein [Rhodospirillales bacterium]
MTTEYKPFARLFLIFLSVWPLQAKAECSLSELNGMRSASVVGIAEKYHGADHFYLIVNVGPGASVSSGRVSPTFLAENVTRVAKSYLEERMLPCLENDGIEVITSARDKRLQEQNTLTAFVDVQFVDGSRHLKELGVEDFSDYVILRLGYFRNPLPTAFQEFSGYTRVVFLRQRQDDLERLLEQSVRAGLKPEWKYEVWE